MEVLLIDISPKVFFIAGLNYIVEVWWLLLPSINQHFPGVPFLAT